MRVITTAAELDEWRRDLPGQQTVGFVPTMGNLHEGHLTLVREAKRQCHHTIASIFVNPTQFGPNEDFDSYPRTLDEDTRLLEKEGIDILFAPSVTEMYPLEAAEFFVTVPESMENKLCGKNRPGHFRGVATVVSKLFNMVRPTDAFFGKKDFQQLAILKRMASDMRFPITITGVDTVREKSGLARSSRNNYLTDSERLLASSLYKFLQSCRESIENSRDGFRELEARYTQLIENKGFSVDYLEICNASTLEPAKPGDDYLLVAVAAKIGKTRLIDNLDFKIV